MNAVLKLPNKQREFRVGDRVRVRGIIGRGAFDGVVTHDGGWYFNVPDAAGNEWHRSTDECRLLERTR